MRFYTFLILTIPLLIALSCRSHKESAVAQSSFVEMNSTAQVNETINKVRDANLNSSISFDSIEIFIQRNWNSPFYDSDNPQSVWLGLSQGESMATTDSMRISSKSKASPAPYSETIGIKAYNAKAQASNHTKDSIECDKDSSFALEISEDDRMENAVSSKTVAVFDPPDLKAVVCWSLSIAAVIIIIVCLLKRKLNP